MTEPGRQPLVVVFPPGWTPPDGAAFFDGIDVNWMRLTTLADATSQLAQPLAADRFDYPSWQVNHEVDDEAFAAVAALGDEADRLQGVLAEPTTSRRGSGARRWATCPTSPARTPSGPGCATVNTSGWVAGPARARSPSRRRAGSSCRATTAASR